ncbi:MAG: T9SS type A sorting domain-containing protein [Ignavibacteria bacterium]|nr:T9SS type A sorting domain-containing protein [Ignavibacteria bacterium]
MKVLNKFTKAFFILMFALMSLNASKAQNTSGTDFWLMFMDNYGPYSTTSDLTLFITSSVNTSGTVTVTGLGFSTPFNVLAGVVTPVVLPNNALMKTDDAVGNLGIHVTALNDVTVYGLNRISATTDAFLGLPTSFLGTDYIVLGYTSRSASLFSEFGIVAAQNGTVVTVTPTAVVNGKPIGVPYNINLNQGETYNAHGTSDGDDLTGTTITSNNPIAVYGGHQCGNVPNDSYGACDHMVEQLPPTNTWGKNFVTCPLATRIGGDTWRFLASDNNTVVTINGVAQAPINKGQFIQTILTTSSIITSDKPILAGQYSNSSSFDGVTSDPFIMLIPPYEQFLGNYTVTTPASGFSQNFINVVAPNAVVGALTLDGVPVPAINFTPIGASGFSAAKLPVALGSHNLVSTLPFGCFMYGFDSYDSYGYPGGQALSQVATVSSLDVTPEIATNIVGTQHCVDGLVKDQNGIPLAGIRVDYLISGANPGAGFAFTNAGGIAQYCYTGTNVGYDTIIGSTGSLSDTVLKIWQSALPVELSSFTSVVDNKDVLLKWSTVMELNNSGFDIERTSDHNTWTKVGYAAGNGTTNEIRNYEFRDRNLASGLYNYRLKQIDFNGNFEYFNLSNEVEIGIPDKFSLSQNYPNPFNPNTKIGFEIPKEGNVTLSVYDNGGKLVSTLVSGNKPAGYYTIDFNASNLSSGVYFYKIEYSGQSKVMKMSVVK